MALPKDVVCIESLIGTAYDSISRNTIRLSLCDQIIANEVYTVVGEDDTYYELQGKDPKTGYAKICFRDLDEINIEEVTEILKEELCQI